MARPAHRSHSVATSPPHEPDLGWLSRGWRVGLWFSTGVGFLMLAYAVTLGATASWDATVSTWIVHTRNSAWTGGALVLARVGQAVFITLWASGSAAALDRHFRTGWRCVSRVLAVLVLDVTVVFFVKNLIDRPRPEPGLRLTTEATWSFPSGHATATTAAVSMLLLCLYALPASRRSRAWATWVGALVVLAMAWSRVYLGVHHLTDVVAGILLGVWLALTAWWLFDVSVLSRLFGILPADSDGAVRSRRPPRVGSDRPLESPGPSRCT